MPSVYQKIAINHKARFNRTNKNWCTDGIHLNPGRMFIRDKANLTKGEREIIAGIYKNRGDTSAKAISPVGSGVKSHKDAWLTGKQVNRGKVGNLTDFDKSTIRIPENLFCRLEPQIVHSERSYTCDKCKEDCSLSDHCRRHKLGIRFDANGQKAPPTSPELSPLTERKLPKNPKTNEGAVFVESGKTFYDAHEGAKKKKVYVDVFLPKFPTHSLHEEKTSLTNTDPQTPRSFRTSSETQPKMFKLAERSPEHTDEGYSSHEKSPITTKQNTSRSQHSRSSSKTETDLCE